VADLKLPFGEFLLQCIREYRKANTVQSAISDRMWVDEFTRWHEAWHAARKRAKLPPVVSRDAEAIYALYPRKIGKQAALRAIVRAMDKVSKETLIERVRNYAAVTSRYRPPDRQFIPHPSSWFNQGRYDDDPREWERPDMRPEIGVASSAPQGPVPEPAAGWALRLKSIDPTDEYAAGGTCNRAGTLGWDTIDPYYQRRIVKRLLKDVPPSA
jgi:hypothetical protein